MGNEDSDKASVHQKLAWATGDREDEARALADQSGASVDEEDALVAVERAHGERRDEENADPDSELATADDARRAAADDR
jgi:hypothetical protein